MNSWKQYPNLFANGKFKVKSEAIKFMPDSADVIEGIECDCFYVKGGGVVPIPDCTLIARKIEDMSDKELNNSPNFSDVIDHKWAKGLLIRRSKEMGDMPTDIFLYLLSIGVYPFDQKHFEEGTVIDSKTAQNQQSDRENTKMM